MEKQTDAFQHYGREVAASIDAVKKKIHDEKKNRSYIPFGQYPIEKLEVELEAMIKGKLGIEDSDFVELGHAPAHISGDLCFEVFDMAKRHGKNPAAVALSFSSCINEGKGNMIHEASAFGGFVNLVLHKDTFYHQALACSEALGDRFGENDRHAGAVVVIDYSAPNIAKPIGVGHLRSTIIGAALANLYENSGYSTIRDNHIGDWGTQFGALIYAYKTWGDEAAIEREPIRELKNLYVRFHEEVADHPEIQDKARNYFLQLEEKNAELANIWKRFRDLSLRDFGSTYQRLGVTFDLTIGESYFIDDAHRIVNECLARALCRIDHETGAVVVDEAEGLPSFLLRKKDGASLYMSRDIACLRFRIETFNPAAILYVVGNEQELNFRQLFSFCRRAGFLPAGLAVEHIGFGMVLTDGKKMSTRRGTLIELEDLLGQSIEKSKEIVARKGTDGSSDELDAIAHAIGVGAILYNDLKQSRVKNISFDWKRMLDLEGGSAVYLQYTVVRIHSILRKLGEVGTVDTYRFEGQTEFALARKLMMFPSILLKAQEANAPHHLCTYLEELASAFNTFYNEVSIVQTEQHELKTSRAVLSRAVARVIRRGLALLNITVPNRM
ncbi:arginine--tRNA ligase [Candidatus Uhrbacteria bacterium]|nr:arginine--tRNA ligase [Candidatus Uhrbacteria bacterium]